MGFLFDKLNMLVMLVFLACAWSLDSQMFFSQEYYHDSLIELRKSYQEAFKDPMAGSPPEWLKTLIAFFLATNTPYYLLAIILFAKGNCACIRTPSIMYASSMLTGLVPILHHVWTLPLEGPGVHPETTEELYKLFLIYFAFAFYHVLFLLYFLRNSTYGSAPAVTTTHAAKKAKKN